MRKKGFIFCMIAFLGVSLKSPAQQNEAVLNYISTYKDLAIAEMKRTRVPAAITLAQGIHESGAGKSKLVMASNNHFGIKCKSNWTGESVRHDDDARGECFRKYPQAVDSYRDHSDFLMNGQRYAFLFSLDPADYSGWANGLRKAGYATNPKYPQVLIKLIEDYDLQQYTLSGLESSEQGMQTGNEPAAVYKKETMPAEVPVPPAPATADPVPAAMYPAGMFTINESKVVFVKKGTPYLAIATQYGVDLSRLFEYNEMPRAEETGSDQLIFLQPKRKNGATDFHLVTEGESLHAIAQKEGIRLESLLEYNRMAKQNHPQPGTRLSLKKKPH
jgi:Mannosyl-glycoprotein endo-beta-N-acetylglucosaminidase/LysM domain